MKKRLEKKSGKAWKTITLETFRYLFFMMYVFLIAAALYSAGSFFETQPLPETLPGSR